MLDDILSKADRGAAALDADQQSPKPFDLAQASIGDFLDTPAPTRRWLVPDLLPLGTVGLMAAGGGTGKSMLVLQLGVAIAAGLQWLGMDTAEHGGVLIVSAEDDRAEAHRRIRLVVGACREEIQFNGGDWSRHDHLLRERMFIVDRVGKSNLLTRIVDKALIRTDFADRVIATAQGVPDCRLIVLDPLSRFDGGEPNSSADGTRLIETAESIRKATGATVLLPHHVNKASLKDAQSGSEAARGSSGLVDGARWMGLMATMRTEHASGFGIDEADAGQYVRLTVPKSNYAAPYPGMWLKRGVGGVLHPTELTPRDPKAQTQARKTEERYAELKPKLLELVQRKQINGTPLTHRALRDFAGTGGLFGVGDRTLRSILARAIEEGAVKEHQPEGKRHAELHTW